MNVASDYKVREPSSAMLALGGDLVFTPDLAGLPPGYTIEDPLRGKFYRVGIAEFTFLSLLDGRTSTAEAIGRAAGQLGPQALSEQEALALCRWLLDCRLAHTTASLEPARLCESGRKAANRRFLGRINPLMMKLPLVNPDRLLAAAVPALGWLLSPRFFALWACTCLYALYLVMTGWSGFTASAGVILDRENWLCLAASWAVLKVLHESWHGLACKKYGGNVPEAGITLLLLAPLAYVDVTSSWRFRSRWQRIATAAAGMYIELFAAALAAIVWAYTSPGRTQQLALNIAVMAGFNTLVFNGNPLLRFDGYFILSDLLAIPNLYPAGQQYLLALVQKYVLGQEVPQPNWPPAKAAVIKLYAIAALAWRVLFFLTLALVLAGLFAHFGILLALVLLACAWGIPAVRAIKLLVRSRRQQAGRQRRWAVVVGVCAGAVALVAVPLCRPAKIEAPAVFEYAPLSMVRVGSPGFVREILARDGDAVRAGQVLAVLENEELSAELADLRLQFEQSIIKGRMYYQDEQLGKCQVERANQDAIKKRLTEAGNRVAALTVRAPTTGRLLAKDFDSLVGRYLPLGSEMAVVGDERSKELVIAACQDDLDLFRSQLGSEVDVRLCGGSPSFSARLVKVYPCGSAELPHPALAAAAGGPLAVKVKTATKETGERSTGGYELLTPAFVVKAEVPPAEGPSVHAGQLVTISFRSPEELVAARLIKSLGQWGQRQTAPKPTHCESPRLAGR